MRSLSKVDSENIYTPKSKPRGFVKRFIKENFDWSKYKVFKIKASWTVSKEEVEENNGISKA